MSKKFFTAENVAIDLSQVVVIMERGDEAGFLVLLEGQDEALTLFQSGPACFDALVAYWETLCRTL